METSMILIAIIGLNCSLEVRFEDMKYHLRYIVFKKNLPYHIWRSPNLMATHAEACLAPAACCAIRGHVDTLRSVTRALSRVANLLLLYGGLMENASLMQIYLWYTLAFIVVGFPLALADMLLALKHKERWCWPDFLSEVVFLFVLSRCLPLVDTYRKQVSELGQVKYSD